MGAEAANARPWWKCPKCGRQFKQKSAYHGCGQYTIEGYLAGKNPAAIALFNSLAAEATRFPGVTISPAKTMITFRVRANFLSLTLTGKGIQGFLHLPSIVPKPYFKKTVSMSSRRHGHMFRIDDLRDLEDFVDLLPQSIALVTDSEQKTPRKKSGRPSTIGEEINALYRAERRL